MIGPMMKVLATPERLAFGLKQMVAYEHANGVTAYNEPGALYTPDMWKLYEQILGAPDTPMYSTFLADGRGIPDRVGLDKALDATEEQIAVAPAGAGQEAHVLSQAGEALRRRRDHLAADADEGRLSRRPSGRMDHAARRTRRSAPNSTGTPAIRSTSTSMATSASTSCSTCSRRRMRGKSARRPSHRDRPFRQLDGGAGRAHRRSGRDRQRQPVLHDRLRRQVWPGRPRPEARRHHGAGGFRAREAGMSLSYHSDLPMGPSDPLYLAWCGRQP